MISLTLPDGTRVSLIGDPHLGRSFEVGTPLKRKGHREAMQLQQFKDELHTEADVIVVVGDLFDHPYVSYSVIQTASDAIVEAVVNNPRTTYVVMAGNHDMPRNVTKVGAFDDFRERLENRFDNLYIINQPQVIQGVACFPWEWDRRADEQVRDFASPKPAAYVAVGHWDLATFNGKDAHLAPVEALQEAFGDIPLYSGHYHISGEYTVSGRTVHCVGSLQPYTHGEDPTGWLYVTTTSDVARDQALSLVNKHVRIRRKRGEDMPDLDCLSLTFIYDQEPIDEGATPNETPSPKDWASLMASKIAELDPRVQDFIKDRMNVEAEEQR